MKKFLSLAILVLAVFVFVGCSEQVPDVAVNKIIADIEKEVEVISGLMEVDILSKDLPEINKQIIKAYSINPDDIVEGIIKCPMINLQVDEVVIIKAKDKSKIPVIQDALKKHVETQLAAFENYVPQNYEIVKNHILKSEGNYILLAISKDAQKIEAIFDNNLK